jgi:hypothetical protein
MQSTLLPISKPTCNRRRQPGVPVGCRRSVPCRQCRYRRRCRQVPTGNSWCRHVPTGTVGAGGCAARYPPCRAALSVPNLQFGDIPKVASYVMKGQRGMSKATSAACSEARAGNLGIKEVVRHMGNVYFSCERSECSGSPLSLSGTPLQKIVQSLQVRPYFSPYRSYFYGASGSRPQEFR